MVLHLALPGNPHVRAIITKQHFFMLNKQQSGYPPSYWKYTLEAAAPWQITFSPVMLLPGAPSRPRRPGTPISPWIKQQVKLCHSIPQTKCF